MVISTGSVQTQHRLMARHLKRKIGKEKKKRTNKEKKKTK